MNQNVDKSPNPTQTLSPVELMYLFNGSMRPYLTNFTRAQEDFSLCWNDISTQYKLKRVRGLIKTTQDMLAAAHLLVRNLEKVHEQVCAVAVDLQREIREEGGG